MQIFVSINMAELNTITISKDKKMRKETVKMWKDLKKGEAAGKNCLIVKMVQNMKFLFYFNGGRKVILMSFVSSFIEPKVSFQQSMKEWWSLHPDNYLKLILIKSFSISVTEQLLSIQTSVLPLHSWYSNVTK